VRRRSASGFTLIELMVAMALATLVVGGALQLHASFGKQTERQNQVAEMQQNLRVSMLMIEHAIRNAGYGIPGGMLPESSSNNPACNNGVHRTHYGFEWSNSNVFNDPMVNVAYAAKSATANDVDPDYFWVMSALPAELPVYATSDVAPLTTLAAPTTVSAAAPFLDHELYAIVYPSTSSICGQLCSNITNPPTNPPTLPAQAALKTSIDYNYGHCIREISAHNTSGTTKTISHAPGGTDSYCFDSPPIPTTPDVCNITPSTQLRHFKPTVTAYRVMPSGDTYNSGSGSTPKLTMRSAPMNTAYNANWTVIAENIDDMQIAVISQAGLVCNQYNDPSFYYPVNAATSCDITNAAAVRVTLSARSSSKMEGVTVDTTPYAEDRIALVPADPTVVGYLHRSLTAEIELRNMGSESTQ
jgi:prepilin-type N-terminal cleavage/methylation domain-containing protein